MLFDRIETPYLFDFSVRTPEVIKTSVLVGTLGHSNMQHISGKFYLVTSNTVTLDLLMLKEGKTAMIG